MYFVEVLTLTNTAGSFSLFTKLKAHNSEKTYNFLYF